MDASCDSTGLAASEAERVLLSASLYVISRLTTAGALKRAMDTVSRLGRGSRVQAHVGQLSLLLLTASMDHGYLRHRHFLGGFPVLDTGDMINFRVVTNDLLGKTVQSI